MAGEPTQVEIDGHHIKLTNLNKVLYPATGTTKGDVIAYLHAIAPVMLPHLQARAVTRKRWPNGIDSESFFTKNLERGAPAWIDRVEIDHSSGGVIYPVIDSTAGLIWLGQIAALEIHVPQWRFENRVLGGHAGKSGKVTRGGTERHPDRVVFDLDPGPGTGLAECVEVALLVRERLGALGERMVPVTSGSKGLHLYVPMDEQISADQASAWALQVAGQMQKALPDLVVSEMTKALRRDRVFFDWSQNNASKTTIAPYSLRGRDHPMVAAPRTWDELAGPDLQHLEMDQVLDRVARGVDPLASLLDEAGPERKPRYRSQGPSAVPTTTGQDEVGGSDSQLLPSDETRSGGTQSDGTRSDDTRGRQLDAYRAKRAAGRTPEPMPPAGPLCAGGDDTFVIQEHHASRLHWDLRLERDGVLVSWAVPKGIPLDATENRLAVQTEDHPMQYAGFEGTIPAKEYGGGVMTIWDSGTYETLKWRDSEIMVDLSGTRVQGRYVLIRTNNRNWLLHRMKESSQHLDAAELAKHPRDRKTQVTASSRTVAAGTSSANEPPADSASVPIPSEDPQSPPPVPVDLLPMTATVGSEEQVQDTTRWRYEGKWDGMRALAFVDSAGVRVLSRAGNDNTLTFPELAELSTLMNGHTGVLDGEIVAFDNNGRTDFGLMQQRMGLRKIAEITVAAARVPAKFLIFDVLHLDGISLLTKKYDDRRRLLEALQLRGENCQVPEQLTGSISEVMALTKAARWEGVIAKRRDSSYSPGTRTRLWLKVKHELDSEVVIVGWQPGQGRRSDGIGSLLLAVPGADDESGWRYVGKVGTGFTDAMLADLLSKLKPLRRATPPLDVSGAEVEVRGAQWVRPNYVAEVIYAEITPTGRLRQPRWRGLRPDKSISVTTGSVINGIGD